MVVVLGQGDDVALRGDLEAAAPAHLHVGTLKLADHGAITLKHGNVEAVAVAVPDQHVPGIADVYAVGEVGDILAANAT